MRCPFCQIAARQLPATIIYENQWTMAILPKNPAAESHLLVIPKQHVTSILACDEEIWMRVYQEQQKIGGNRLREIW